MASPDSSTGNPHAHPLGDAAPKEDYVGLAFNALLLAVAAGVGLNALVTWTVRTLQANGPAAQAIDLGAAPTVTLLAGTFIASAVAALITWRVTRPIRSPYRQGMLGTVSAFGTLLCSMIAVPIDHLFGRIGLLGLAGVAIAALLWAKRRLQRDAAGQ